MHASVYLWRDIDICILVYMYTCNYISIYDIYVTLPPQIFKY